MEAGGAGTEATLGTGDPYGDSQTVTGKEEAAVYCLRERRWFEVDARDERVRRSI